MRLNSFFKGVAGIALFVGVMGVVNVVLPFVFAAQARVGRVVDRTTGRGIADATVAALWTLEGGLVGNGPTWTIHVAETRTGPDGTFRFQPWGPRFYFGWGRLHERQPLLIVGSERYLPLAYFHSIWNDKRMDAASRPWPALIALQVIGSQRELAASFQDVQNRILDAMAAGRRCQWSQLPRTRQMIFDHYGNDRRGGFEVGPAPNSAASINLPCSG